MKTQVRRGGTRLALAVLAVTTIVTAVWPSAPALFEGAASGDTAYAAPDLHAARGQVVPLPPAPTPAPPLSTCRPPIAETGFPSPAAELRLVRDEGGNYWQIQAGCRHAVVPFVMDTATLAGIPQGEDVTWVSYGLPQPVPTLAPLADPAYALLPEYLRGLSVPPPPIRPAAAAPPPGVLTGYTNRVLVVDPTDPSAVYVLDGRLRHRVLVYFPYCAIYPLPLPLCGGSGLGSPNEVAARALARGGDPALETPFSYLLPRRADAAADCRTLFPNLNLPRAESCVDLYARLILEALLTARPTRDENERQSLIRLAGTLANEAGGYIASIDEIPLGEPAPYYGWARGESVVISDRVRPPDAVKCEYLSASIANCSRRFRQARVLNLGQFAKDPESYSGQDVRAIGVACGVRYDRGRNTTYFSLGFGTTSVFAAAPGRLPAQDAELVDNAVLEVGAAVTAATSTLFNTPGQFIVFEYRRLPRTGVCE